MGFRTLRMAFIGLIFMIMFSTTLILAFIVYIAQQLGLAAPATAIFEYMLIILLISVVLGTSIAAIVSEKVIYPFHTLIQATQEVSKGNFNVRIEESYHGEIQYLMDNFNAMACELNKMEVLHNDFINNFSHEFKTPIASIKGFAKLLKKPDLPAEQRDEYTDIIIKETQRLSRLSSNILMLSKIENQQFITEQSLFDVDEQLRSAILLLEKEWSSKNIEFHLKLERTHFYGNEEMLQQVWINILGNAIKFTGDNGSIYVFCTCDFGKDRRNGTAVVVIRDTGIGMDKETLDRIYEKFYQGENARTIEGNGLGMAMVRSIIDIFGGDIKVESKPKEGTSFVIKLPFHLPEVNRLR